MPYKDLREYIANLEERGLLVRVKCEVDPEWEINGITRKLQDEHGPAVLFEKVKGYPMAQLLSEPFNTEPKLLAALETTSEKLPILYRDALEHPLPRKTVETGPVKENMIQGDQVDIAKYPVPLWHKNDGGRYIMTMSALITKDPDTGRMNAGVYRGMILSRNTFSCYFFSQMQHGYLDFLKYEEKNEPMPVALVTGCDPAIMVAATNKYPYNVEEYSVAGALRGEPVETVKCESIDLEVPATSEIVFEGEMLPNKRVNDGPFGEYHGYYGKPMENATIIKVNIETYRNNPTWLGTRAGRYPGDGYGSVFISSLHLKDYLKKTVPGVVDVNVPGECVGHASIISIKQAFPGHAKRVMNAVWGGDERGEKIVIVVDEDIDVHNWGDVLWAIATRFEPHRDAVISLNHHSNELDPSLPPSMRGVNSHLGINATKPMYEYRKDGSEFPASNHDDDIIKRVRDQWKEYGIKWKSS